MRALGKGIRPSVQAIVAGLLVSVVIGGSLAAGVTSATDGNLARVGLLTLRDFPPGWAPKPGSASRSSGALVNQLVSKIAACRKYKTLIAAKAHEPKARSSQFTDGSVTISDAVVVRPTAADAAARFAIEKNDPGYVTCYQDLLKRLTAAVVTNSGQPVENLRSEFQAANPGTTAGDDQAAFAATISLTTRGVDVTAYFEIVGIRVGRTITSFTYESESGPINDVLPSVIQAPVTRLSVAQQ